MNRPTSTDRWRSLARTAGQTENLPYLILGVLATVSLLSRLLLMLR